jgi:hypothetical protein
MNNSKYIKYGLLHSLAGFVYVFLVASLMTNNLFGAAPGVLAGVGILLLLVLSVAVVGMLIFGKPAMMYVDGQKKEALMLLLYTICWLAVIIVIVLVLAVAFFRRTGLY